MFVFGLWHKGSVLFMLWGTYHGLLLVAHRQWQQLQSRTGLRLPSILLTPISWLATFSAISVGWIFFRADNLHRATGMLRAAFSPRGFLRLGLPRSFCVLVVLLAAGYFLVVAAGELLDRWGRAGAGLESGERSAQHGYLSARFGMAIVAQDRWVWVAPLVVVLGLYLYILLKPEVAGATPMLYRLF